jgi:hypothetical protein
MPTFLRVWLTQWLCLLSLHLRCSNHTILAKLYNLWVFKYFEPNPRGLSMAISSRGSKPILMLISNGFALARLASLAFKESRISRNTEMGHRGNPALGRIRAGWTGYLTRLQCSVYAAACRFARPRNWPPLLSRGSGTSTSEFSRNQSSSYESHISTWVNREFPRLDSHLLQTQPYGPRTHRVTTASFVRLLSLPMPRIFLGTKIPAFL